MPPTWPAPAAAKARHWQERANLLTPVAKAFSTDVGVEVASIGVQVHGGMGFIEETGAANLYRDARIAPIYEGTNGIQAIDLVTRKLPQAGGEHVLGYIGELSGIVEALRNSNLEGFGRTADNLERALADLKEATRFLQERVSGDGMQEALAGATPYLRLFALAAGGAYLAKGAIAEKSTGRIALCRFFAENLVGEGAGAERPCHQGRRQPGSRGCRACCCVIARRIIDLTDHILIERQGAVQAVRMNRPDKKNAITRAMYAAMAAALSGRRCRSGDPCPRHPRRAGCFFVRQRSRRFHGGGHWRRGRYGGL